jgi:hypothetical protein
MTKSKLKKQYYNFVRNIIIKFIMYVNNIITNNNDEKYNNIIYIYIKFSFFIKQLRL